MNPSLEALELVRHARRYQPRHPAAAAAARIHWRHIVDRAAVTLTDLHYPGEHPATLYPASIRAEAARLLADDLENN